MARGYVAGIWNMDMEQGYGTVIWNRDMEPSSPNYDKTKDAIYEDAQFLPVCRLRDQAYEPLQDLK